MERFLPFLQNLDPAHAARIEAVIVFVGILLAAFVANWIAKKGILRVIHAITRRTPFQWDQVFVRHRFFTRLSHLVPAMIIQHLSNLAFGHEGFIAFVETAVALYLILIAYLVFSAFVNATVEIAGSSGRGRELPLTGFGQAVKLIAFLVAGIFVVSVLFDRSPLLILSGLGALTAVLLLVFRDAILGFVAGVMLSVNDMVRVGDWIEMPANDADGDVIDVSLTTIKVRNWDQTYTTIPTYDLISKSFRNWRGMQESGGRRVMRSIPIDSLSIRFMDEEMMGRFTRFQLLRPYLDERIGEIDQWNAARNADLSEMINGRRLTNIGCFRAYCIAYIKAHPKVRQDMTFLVRQLEPGPRGLPLQIYLFTDTTAWAEYESIQADIFDHLLAVLPLFGLRTYQFPSDKADQSASNAGVRAVPAVDS